MSKTTKRNLMIAVLLSVIATGVFGLMVYYVSGQGAKLAQQIAALELQHAQEDSFITARRLAENTEADRALLQSYFLERASDSIDFLNQVETLAPQVGVTLRTSGLDSYTDESDGSEWIKISFSFSGSRANVHEFLKILETYPYVSHVTEVQMASQTNAVWSATVDMQVRVLAYDE